MYEHFVIDEEQNQPRKNIPASYATFSPTPTSVVATPVTLTPNTPVVSTPVVSTPVVSTPVVSTPVVSTPYSKFTDISSNGNQNLTISGNVGQTISANNGIITSTSSDSGGGLAVGVIICIFVVCIAAYVALIYFGLKIRKQCTIGDNQNNIIAIGLIISIILMFTPLSPLASTGTLIMIILGANICGK